MASATRGMLETLRTKRAELARHIESELSAAKRSGREQLLPDERRALED